MSVVDFGWFGKHPAFGDFVARGVSEPVQMALQDWLDGALASWRVAAGKGWAAQFDEAPPLRFWIGARVLGQGRSGVLLPSRDRVGRRYPLVLLMAGSHLPPPLEPEQDAHDALEDAARALLADANMEVGGDGMPARVDDGLWAINAVSDAGTLLADIAAEDMCRVAQTRSYWWVARDGDRPARVISANGLPDGAQLGWVLTADVPVPERNGDGAS